jgi:hypothetical protein
LEVFVGVFGRRLIRNLNNLVFDVLI